MSKTIRKTSIVLALLMAFLMVFLLLPLNVKAQETIEITQEDLNTAKSNPGTTGAKGIVYKDGVYRFTESAEYVLDGLINLDGECLSFCSEDGPSVLNLNNNFIASENTSVMGAVSCSKNPLTIKGNGQISCDDEGDLNGIAVYAENDITIMDCSINGRIISDEDTLLTIKSGNIGDVVTVNGNADIQGGNFGKAVDFKGDTNISGGKFYSSVIFKGDTTISNGIFYKKVDINNYTTIKGGTFNDELSVFEDTYIYNGVFNDAVIAWNGSTIIYDGEFQAAYLQGDSAILMILGGSFYNTCIFEAGNGYIYGGKFEYKGDSQMIINLTGGALEIWGGEFYNSEDSENAPAIDIIYSSPENNKNTSLIVNGGYFGIAEKYSIFAWGLDYLSVSGGDFVSKGYALGIMDDGNIKVEISGGNFTSLGNWSLSYAPSAAIVCVFQNTEYKDNIFESYLLDGYEYVPKVETNKATGDAGEVAAYTQKELSVIPAETGIIDDGAEASDTSSAIPSITPSNTPSTGDSGYGGWICMGLLAAGALVITPLAIKKKGVLDE